MTEDRMIHQGQRAELRLKRQELTLRMDSLRKHIRIACNELTAPDRIPAEEIFMMATDLRATQIDYQEVAEKLDRLREILGA